MDVSHWKYVSEAINRPQVPPHPYPAWVGGEDQLRVAAYNLYDQIYWAEGDPFKILMRGQEGRPIYLPTGKKIVETAHRFLAKTPEVVTLPEFGSPAIQAEAALFISDFIAREGFASKFSANKRDGLKRGDWIWHLIADPERDPGARISIYALDPALYFPEFNSADERIAAHLVHGDIWRGKFAVRKLSYIKQTGRGGPSPILVRDVICDAEDWGQPNTDTKETVWEPIDEYLLDPPIDQIPVYHIPNLNESNETWGSSEMRGVERLMGSINQAITDEEITLILEGLGVYVTDAGQPVDDEGNPVPWNLGPARVVEVPDGKQFTRVNSAGTVTPYLEHLAYLERKIDEATGGNDATHGVADVRVVESGIALLLRMGPLISRMDEKELIIRDTCNKMLFDLRRWFIAYEGMPGFEEIRWAIKFGEKMPLDKDKLFDQVLKLAVPTGTGAPIISAAEARAQLIRIGWTFTQAEEVLAQQIIAEQVAAADAIAAQMGRVTGG